LGSSVVHGYGLLRAGLYAGGALNTVLGIQNSHYTLKGTEDIIRARIDTFAAVFAQLVRYGWPHWC